MKYVFVGGSGDGANFAIGHIKFSRFGQAVELDAGEANEHIAGGLALLPEESLSKLNLSDEFLQALKLGGRERVSRFDPNDKERSADWNQKLLRLDEAVGSARKKASFAAMQARKEKQEKHMSDVKSAAQKRAEPEKPVPLIADKPSQDGGAK